MTTTPSSRLMSDITASEIHRLQHRLLPVLVLCSGLISSAGWAADAGLCAGQDIDPARMERIRADERRLLRAESKSGFSAVEEQRILDDMLKRLEHIDSMTREVHQLIQAMPTPGARPTVSIPVQAPPAKLDDNDALSSGFWTQTTPMPAKLAIGASAALLLMGLWVLRRRSSSIEPGTPPAARVSPSPPPPAIRQRAVPPAPTFAPATPPAPPAPEIAAPEPATHGNDSNPHEALELAEIMLSMGLASGAAQTLTEHIRHNPKQALHLWLKLLDVHRKSGNKQQFEESSRELQQHFNIQAENWAQLHAGEVTTLENYERVSRHIESVWQQPAEALNYLKHLLEDNRGGTRAGFPQPVAEEILLLIAILKETWGRS